MHELKNCGISFGGNQAAGSTTTVGKWQLKTLPFVDDYPCVGYL